MMIKEYRITLPLTVAEYQIGQLYTVAEASKNEMGGGEGIEIIANEPFAGMSLYGGKYSKGQFTHKVYHVHRKIPSYLRVLLSGGAQELHEKSWNAYPYIKTIITNTGFQPDKFSIAVESLHLPDRGEQGNVHSLSSDKLKMRELVVIDVGNDPFSVEDVATNPATFISVKTGRGPFVGPWCQSVEPVMTCYKLITVEFKIFGFQKKLETFVHRYERKILTTFHREVVCWMDRWWGLTISEIRTMEERTRAELQEQIVARKVKGSRWGKTSRT